MDPRGSSGIRWYGLENIARRAKTVSVKVEILAEFSKHVDRLLADVPGNVTTVDLQPLFFRFV